MSSVIDAATDPPSPAGVAVDARGITKQFDGTPVLRQVSLPVAPATMVALLGPSGCGKTTLLRILAGLETPDEGEVRIGGELLTGPRTHVPPERRRVGMVFQDYALFPHLTVADNVAFGLRQLDAAARARRVADTLEVIGMARAGGRYPHELSGGQQQRVALARALAPQPELLLLDEPFSNLDADVRTELAHAVRAALLAEGATALLVTHDQREAFAIADEIGVLRAGRLEQWDAPWKLYHAPKTRFVADFVGEGTFIPGTVIGPGRVSTELGVIEGQLTRDQAPGSLVDLLLRPDDVIHDDASDLHAEVVERAGRSIGRKIDQEALELRRRGHAAIVSR